MSHQRGHFESSMVFCAPRTDACGEGRIPKREEWAPMRAESWRASRNMVRYQVVRDWSLRGVTRGARQKPVPNHEIKRVQTSLSKNASLRETRTCGEGVKITQHDVSSSGMTPGPLLKTSLWLLNGSRWAQDWFRL